MYPQHTKCTHRQSQFLGHFLLREEDLELQLVALDRFLKATPKKVVNFFEEKSAPPTKSWLRLCVVVVIIIIISSIVLNTRLCLMVLHLLGSVVYTE